MESNAFHTAVIIIVAVITIIIIIIIITIIIILEEPMYGQHKRNGDQQSISFSMHMNSAI
jgi:hypothetical protein